MGAVVEHSAKSLDAAVAPWVVLSLSAVPSTV